ncbi:EmrA/EmrK family multidrug efflux transporter periplasmic adaptor subunit [Malaciobacter molluscorum LMG 25693]|uniref:EmrA/EmrK family multidrug efflux transporter periplasmic adaptor subunit n=1 Tax=Malaciobacter molluscorum LMG 25693 TaxID=870501 RepID=A0A2G1DKF4_9BACT|nr:HlyD family secretion protein [Malaciobacter molluscorum]AXX92578.1 multidrug resistance efflux protein, EmrA family [Malaciobacter molluscorum LMG 25693]PHO19003.1 EmrA/EmrK family multidrug efflux transporter periplasmic adaptor subunit [Malaciobacter molluscorum LMG 25693]
MLKEKRKKYLSIFFLFIFIVAIIYIVYHFIYASNFISTENAYTKADVAQVIPKINAPVKDVKVIDTQYVNKGDIIIILDDEDAKIALKSAKANLEEKKREIEKLISNDEEFIKKINLDNSKINLLKTTKEKAYIELQKAKKDLIRYSHLLKSKSISQQNFDDIKLAYDNAKKSWQEANLNLESAITSKTVTKAQKQSNLQLIKDKKIETNPQVLRAKANYEKALLDLKRTIIKAPISGIVTQKNVKIGQFVNTNSQLLTIVPISKIYVNANFKESKLKDLKIGQKVELFSDLYGENTIYHGVVEGISSATGSELSLIPAQNATGNWIKVVQRLPIRIKLNEDELLKKPLYTGLSMHVKVSLDKSN